MKSIPFLSHPTQDDLIAEMIERLERDLGDGLKSVVLYGPAARGEHGPGGEQLQLMLLVADLDFKTLRVMSAAVNYWLKKGQPMPKFFSPAFMSAALDVFPLEFLEIEAHHEVLFGSDPFSSLQIRTDNLRLQCEREFREKMMRLREGYIECDGSERLIRHLLSQSYVTFVEIFRGCLRLRSRTIPLHDDEVITEFSAQAEILQAPFLEIERLALRQETLGTVDEIFASYYRELSRAVDSIDRFVSEAALLRREGKHE